MLTKKHKILLVVLVIAVFLSLNKFGGKKIKNTFYLISSPLQRVFFRTGQKTSDFIYSFFEVENLKYENKKLLKRNFILLQKLTASEKLKEENKALRGALGLGLEKKFKLGLTEVLSEEFDQDSILISLGKDGGISGNMPVITKEGVLVGKVKDVYENFSEVLLTSAPTSHFGIEIWSVGSDKSALGVAEGQGNSKIKFDLVPKEAKVKNGDIVKTTNLGGKFPAGLLVGEIAKVQKNDIKPYQKGEIIPYFLKTNLRFLFVIKNFK